MNKGVTVLIVEDSALMRRELTRIIDSDPGCRVVGSAADGEEGLEKTRSLNPDVVTLDINLPGMDGLTCLQHIMLTSPRPCIVISAYAGNDSVETFEALELGAIDFVQKSSGEISRDISRFAHEICRKIKTAAVANLGMIRPQTAGALAAKTAYKSHLGDMPKAAVVIGVSAGGPRTLMQIVPSLPADIGVPIMIVQHMPPKFTASFAHRLDQYSRMSVKEAEDKEPILNNVVYVASGGFNLTLTKDRRGVYALLTRPPEDQIVTPSVEETLRTAIDVFGEKMVGVILTGMGNDGILGMRRLFEIGGETIAESEETAVIYGMPKEVIEKRAANKIVPSHAMGKAIIASVKKILTREVTIDC